MKKITTTGNSIIDLALDFDRQVETSTGVILVHHNTLTAYARKKKINDVIVFLSMDKDKHMSYVIVQDNVPIKDDTSVEVIATYLDIMSFSK